MGEYPLFCNGIPKAGTTLLLNILQQLPKFEYYNRRAHYLYLNQGKFNPEETNSLRQVEKRLRQCHPGEIMKVHLAYEPTLANSLRSLEAKHIFMLRDPRAIVLSMADWWDRVERPDLWAWRYYRSLKSREERIKFLILGWPQYPTGDFPPHVVFPDLGTRMRQFLPWMDDCQSMTIPFETLVDPEHTQAQLRKIIAYLHPSNNRKQFPKLAATLEKGMNPDLSPTFKAGQPDRWKRELTAEAIALCQKVAGKEIAAMGYPLYSD